MPPCPQAVAAKARPKPGSTSGLRAMIAAKRRAAELAKTEEAKEVAKEEEQEAKEEAKAPTISVASPAAKEEVEEDRTFDGGFFSVKSPLRPSASPATSPISPNPRCAEIYKTNIQT